MITPEQRSLLRSFVAVARDGGLRHVTLVLVLDEIQYAMDWSWGMNKIGKGIIAICRTEGDQTPEFFEA